MAVPGELDRGVGERAAPAAALVGELRHPAQQIAQLRLGIAGMLAARRLPQRLALFGELAEVGGDQLVLGGEVPVQRHLVGAGGARNGFDPHRADAVAVEKLARRLQDALARRRLSQMPFQTPHA